MAKKKSTKEDTPWFQPLPVLNSKHEGLMQFYQHFMQAIDLEADKSGYIYFRPPGSVDEEGNQAVIPAAVEGKKWVLPTADFLNDNHWDEVIAFHPMSENFLNGESAVLTKIKAAINLKLGSSLGIVLASLATYAGDIESQKTRSIGASASKYLKEVPNLNHKSAERMVKLIEKSSFSKDRRFINIYLKRGGKLEGNKYTWVATAGFPFRRELDDESRKVFGVQLPKKDVASFQALFDFVIPDNDDLAEYSAYPRASSACKFDALLRTFYNLAFRINEVIDIHKKIIPGYQDAIIDLDWIHQLADIDKLADTVPPLPGNIGEGKRESRKDSVAMKSPVSSRAQQLFSDDDDDRTSREVIPMLPRNASSIEPVSNQPLQRHQTQQAPSEQDTGKLSFTERIRRGQQKSNQIPQGGFQQPQQVGDYQQHRYYGNAPQPEQVPAWMQGDKPVLQPIGSQPHATYRGGQHQMSDRPTRSFAERTGGLSGGMPQGPMQGGGYNPGYGGGSLI